MKHGMHAGMDFLANNQEVRANPERILTNAKSAIVIAIPYWQQRKPDGLVWNFVARYAWFKDYHKSIRKKLDSIGADLEQRLKVQFQWRAIVDTVPFWERAMCEMSGLGSVGKNGCFILNGQGSFVFLATLITSLPAESLANEARPNDSLSICGDCLRCHGACPTKAFVAPYILDARRCLAYWTIEHRGVVPDEFIPYFGKYFFGCDVCQAVCPHNRGAKLPLELESKILSQVEVNGAQLSLVEIARMNEQQYERWFGGTSLTRAKHEGLVRNAIYHLYATKNPELESVLEYWGLRAHVGILPIVEQVVRLMKSG